MNGMNTYAWVVLVPNDDSVESALLSRLMVLKTETGLNIVALVSSSVSNDALRVLDDAFNFVIARNTKSVEIGNTLGELNEQDLLLVSTLNLPVFSKMIVLASGAFPAGGMDHWFDDNGENVGGQGNCILATDKTGEQWVAARIMPNGLQCSGGGLTPVLEKLFGTKKQEMALKAYEYSEETAICLQDIQSCNKRDGVIYVSQKVAKAMLKVLETETKQTSHKEDTSDWVAIVGMSCRFPGANSVAEYWEVFENGRNTCSTPPHHRTALVDMDPDVQANFLKCPIDQFDAGFFRISPSEASVSDPQARLLLEVSWEAFEDAGINPETLKGSKTGVFYGSWLQEYKEALEADHAGSSSLDFMRKYLGHGFGSSGAKLSFFYGFTGPNIFTDSGCSSSMVAVDMAVKSLQRRECPVALACGANLIHQMAKRRNLLAEDGKSKTFDVGADGYARAEGVAVLILKRYSDAIRDGDKIHGIVRGCGASQEGLSKSFGSPTVASECMAMREALRAAKLDPCQVDYVEAHGTGTPVGDPIEASAIVSAYVSEKAREKPLWIGSGKTNMGHSEACSGIAGIIKVILSMQHATVPRHLNVSSLNPKVDFSPIPGEIPLRQMEWERKVGGGARIAGVSSFGITGTDAHVIIQEAPEKSLANPVPSISGDMHLTDTTQVLAISAKSEVALTQLINHFRDHLENSPDSIQDIAFTANACRPHHQYRAAAVAHSKLGIAAKIEAGDTFSSLQHAAKDTRVCFTFPGKIGKADLEPLRVLYETVPYFRKVMDECNAIFKRVTGSSPTLVEKLLSSLTTSEDDGDTLGVLDYFMHVPTYEYALAKLWMHWGVRPTALLGHCSGEFSALLLCGAMKLEDFYTIHNIIPYFLECQQEESPAMMMAINGARNSVEELIMLFFRNNRHDDTTDSNWIDVTCCNASDQTVVAGNEEMIQGFREFCKARHVRCKILSMEMCIHSRAVEPACQKSLQIFDKIKFHPFSIPFVSSATGEMYRSGNGLCGRHLYKVFRNSLNFTQACNVVQDNDLGNVFLEMGCNGALTKFTMSNFSAEGNTSSSHVFLASFSKVGTGLETALANLYTLGVNVDWKNYYAHKGMDKARRVKLPGYPFQRRSFWYERKSKLSLLSETRGPHFGQAPIHPLLGVRLESRAGFDNVVVFQNVHVATMAAVAETQFVADHVIGSKGILPGACFLEMILSAWKLAVGEETEQGISQISAKNFKIQAPLLVDGKISKKAQCVVNKETRMVSVYACGGSESSWKLYASAQVMTEPDNTDTLAGDCEHTLDQFFSAICGQKSWDGGNAVEEFYTAASRVGLNFGDEFKSLKYIHRNDAGDMLVEVGASHSMENVGPFLCHPIFTDAMIQAGMVNSKAEIKRLYVPVKIEQFTLLTSESGLVGNKTKLYVHCKRGSSEISLLDQNGHSLAVMRGLEFVATSVESILNAAGCHTNASEETDSIPPLNKYEVTWKNSRFYQTTNPAVQVCWNSEIATPPLQLAELEEKLNLMNTYSAEDVELDKMVNRLCYLYVVKGFMDLGWVPGKESPSVQYAGEWEIIPSLVPAFRHYLSYLDGREHVNFCHVTDVEREIRDIFCREEVKGYKAMKTVMECGSNLAGILRGSVNPHKILFGERNLADHYYKTSRLFSFISELEAFLKYLISHMFKDSCGGKRALRILEVGAGTGALPRKMIPVLNEMGIPYEYHFTDISPTLVNRGTELFSEGDRSNFVFKTLNIEMDPLNQGFPAEYFDMVVALDVLHATRELGKTIRHIAMVTKQGGRILLGETEKPVRELDICFGILEGYWLFDDGIRSNHCTVDSETWLRLLACHGFNDDPLNFLLCDGQRSLISAEKTAATACTPQAVMSGWEDTSKGWTIFHFGESGALSKLKLHMEKYARRRVAVAEISCGLSGIKLEEMIGSHLTGVNDNLEGILVWLNSDDNIVECRDILELLLCISKCLLQLKAKGLPRFLLVTDGCWELHEEDNLSEKSPIFGAAWGFMRTLKIELPGIMSKCVDLERDSGAYAMATQVMCELWLSDKEAEIVYRRGIRHLRRLSEKMVSKAGGMTIPEEGEFSVQLPESKVVKDVKYVGIRNAINALAHSEVKVEVRSVSLNFKDVLGVLKPSADFEDIRSIGLDFAGVITEVGSNVTRWKAGDAVFGCEWKNGCLASHVKTEQNCLMAMPKNLTFAQAATLPAVFVTAWHCMVNVARLERGQTVLVHAASGGVGLAAIQIASMLGVNVIGTAGSERKRRFLRSQGVDHVFSSRSLEFSQQVKGVTQGQGVDMVLNCLTGPGFKDASLEVCRDGGHFVEISKLDIWSKRQVDLLRPLVAYHIVDVTTLEPVLLQDIMAKLTNFLSCASIAPLSYKVFGADRLVEALGYIQKAKQIGKVIISMPPLTQGERKQLLFNNRSTYLITGGKGAIGFEICRWMIGQGAKWLVLAGRTEASDKVKREIARLEEDAGAVIICKELDISNYTELQKLISELCQDSEMPPLRGVHHCAGTLEDNMIAHQDWDMFAKVLKPKVEGAWNLHRATRSLPLEHFVLHSSSTATFGVAGQSNYVSANAYMDHLAQFRHSRNIPALSISWGLWNAGIGQNLQVGFTHCFSLEDGIAALDATMRDNVERNIVTGLFDFENILKTSPHYRPTFLQDLCLNSTPSTKLGSTQYAEKICAEQLSQVPLMEEYKKLEGGDHARMHLVKKFVSRILCETLGTEIEEVRHDVSFTDMGMDSLMSIEFSNSIYSEMYATSGSRIAVEGDFINVEENDTVDSMSRLICSILENAV